MAASRQSNLLRRVFETVVRRCMAEGLVGGEGFAVDASLIAADANKQRSVLAHEWSLEDLPANATRAVKDYLARLDDACRGILCVSIRGGDHPCYGWLRR
jgi:hypothetical protein